MSAAPWHKRYHSDALAGFMALDLEERGAYQTLLDLMYDRGGPIVDNERLLSGYMGCSLRKWRIIREQLVTKGKIRVESGLVAAPEFNAENICPDKRQPLPRWLRILVIERDGEVCAYCGIKPEHIEIDHVVPVAGGGLDHLDNLTVSCRPCNRSKGAKPIEGWLQ